jgi:hypothetical protein
VDATMQLTSTRSDPYLPGEWTWSYPSLQELSIMSADAATTAR